MLRLIVVSSALLVSACSLVIGSKDKCVTHSDCINGWACEQGRCVVQNGTGGAGNNGSGGSSASGGGSSTGGSGGGTAGGSQPSDGVKITGAVQKGPFKLGATIEAASVSLTDGAVASLGKSSYTNSDLGVFEMSVPSGSLVQLTATGNYFNESTRTQSAGEITLHAIVEVPTSGAMTAFINVVTEMSHRRIRKLIAAGETTTQAIRKAELELKRELGFSDAITLDKATSMNMVGGDSISNSYLLSVSCILVQAARAKNRLFPDDELRNVVNAIAFDLENDGFVEPTLKNTLVEGRAALDPLFCSEGLKKYATSYDSGAQVASILRTFDFDKDGIYDDQDSDADGDGTSSALDKPILIAERSYDEALVADSTGQVWRWPAWEGPEQAASVGMTSPIQALVASRMQSILLLGNGNLWRMGVEEQFLPDSRLTQVVHIALGGCSSSGDVVAVKADGTVWNLGENGTKLTQLTAFSDIAMIAGDPAHNGGYAVIKKDGSLWTAKTSPASPLEPVQALDNMTAVVGGGWYCNGLLALRNDGTAWSWNWDGQGVLLVKKVAENVASIFSVSESGFSMRLVLKDGSVWKLPVPATSPLVPDTQLNQAVQIGSGANFALMSNERLLRRPGSTTSKYEPMYLPR